MVSLTTLSQKIQEVQLDANFDKLADEKRLLMTDKIIIPKSGYIPKQENMIKLC